MAYIRADVECGSNEDITCTGHGICVHETDLQVRGDVERITRVYCDECLIDAIQRREIEEESYRR